MGGGEQFFTRGSMKTCGFHMKRYEYYAVQKPSLFLIAFDTFIDGHYITYVKCSWNQDNSILNSLLVYWVNGSIKMIFVSMTKDWGHGRPFHYATVQSVLWKAC